MVQFEIIVQTQVLQTIQTAVHFTDLTFSISSSNSFPSFRQKLLEKTPLDIFSILLPVLKIQELLALKNSSWKRGWKLNLF